MALLRILAGLSAVLLAAPATRAEETVRLLDDLAAPAAWRALASDDVTARLAPAPAGTPARLRLDFDFNARAGYAAADRSLALELPENFELDVPVAGDLAGNDLEVKFVDASGENVWWYRIRHFVPKPDGQLLRIRRREIQFAWGPTTDRRLRHAQRLQFVVSASRGGAGHLEFGAIRLVSLPPPPASWPDGIASAGVQGVPLPDGSPANAWRCAAAPCELTVDWQLLREFGGIRLEWAGGRRGWPYVASISQDGRDWTTVRRSGPAGPAAEWFPVPDGEARYLRLALADPGAVLQRLALEEPGFGHDRNALVSRYAASGARHDYPRGFTEQSYWTLVGTDGGEHSGLLSEDGALELDVGGPSLEPFVIDGDRVVGWSDVTAEQELAEGDLPLPRVRWRVDGWTLEITALADDAAGGALWARYTLRNSSATSRRLRLVLALRPFQVNPPAQFLNIAGGVAPLARIRWDGQALRTDDGPRVELLVPPERAGLYSFESAAIPSQLSGDWGRAPRELATLDDADGLGSAAVAYDRELPPGGSLTVGARVPWGAAGRRDRASSLADLAAAEKSTARRWRERLRGPVLDAPDAPLVGSIAAALRTAEAHVLMSRRGPVLRPGTRSYARSWIRDGAMMSSALLRLGESRAPEEYLRWYAQYLFQNGKVPCCVDERGADPVPENDSNGEFLFLGAELYRRAGDRALVAASWPQFRAAATYLDELRRSSRPSAADGAPDPYAGLLPPSISHEGYSAKPMHSYWDDFWGLRGLADAAFLARELGEMRLADRYERARGEFARDVAASIRTVTAARGITYVPGAADLGDFDATSTTVALSPGTGPLDLPADLLAATFDRYWDWFVSRRDGRLDWDAYTPYEWRVVGAFVRLGERERALEALRYFMADRRPLPWNQWPEVVTRDPRSARFIGDLPHGWVASDFIRSALDLFAYEREADRTVVLGAGVPADWLAGRGLTVRGLHTPDGPVALRARREGRGVDCRIEAAASPPGGFAVRLPGLATASAVTVNDRPASVQDGEVRVPRAPARIHYTVN
ncbi:MAG: carbohydrate-binding protein [Proteobacteria bacterium]|nr:carbohydrate-binding protein [Pseudomonadota bacterium]